MSGDHGTWEHGPEDAKRAAHEAPKPANPNNYWFERSRGERIWSYVKILLFIGALIYGMMRYLKMVH